MIFDKVKDNSKELLSTATNLLIQEEIRDIDAERVN